MQEDKDSAGMKGRTVEDEEGRETMEIKDITRQGVALRFQGNLVGRPPMSLSVCDLADGSNARVTSSGDCKITGMNPLAWCELQNILSVSKESPSERPDRRNTRKEQSPPSRPDSTSASWDISRCSPSGRSLMDHQAAARPGLLAIPNLSIPVAIIIVDSNTHVA